MSSKLLDLSIFKSAIKLLSNLKTTNNKDNIQILEPLTTIVTLAIISFKNIGTKIAVSSNKIYIHEQNFVYGLANKINYFFAKNSFISFPKTKMRKNTNRIPKN